MKATTYEFSGWQRGDAPVIVTEQPIGAISLAWLADRENQEQLLPAMIALTGERRQAALTVVHYAVYAVTNILIAPFVFDHCALMLAPDQLGVVLDETPNVCALWVGQVALSDPEQPLAHLGALAMQLLAPVALVARQLGKVSQRAIYNITLDALAVGCRRLERSSGNTPSAGWIEELLLATGHQAYQPVRPLLAYPDAGPAVTFYVRRTCCVLHKTPGPHACPACPQYPDDATRLQKIYAWLHALDDADFHSVTGRDRVVQAVG
ncbi:MAG: hypothetical protein U0175_04920 [Caldilineaceae bacterium]